MIEPSRHLLLGEHTDPGPRESNQDTVLSTELPDGRWLVAVADGMGGLAEGERAGKTALATLYRSLAGGADMAGAVREANIAVHRESKGQSMGTTLVASLLDGNRAEIANVGDSRAYHLDPLGLLQVTRDHTMGEEAVRNGAVREDQVASNRWAGALARFLGSRETVDADVFGPLILGEGDWLLLCSDGLHRVLPREDMEVCLRAAIDPKQAARRLVEMALERETQDNVSVALVYRPEEQKTDDYPDDAGAAEVFENQSTDDPPPRPGLHRGTSPSEGAGAARAVGPTNGGPSAWDPDAIFARSPRNEPKRAGVFLAAIVVLATVALLIAALMTLNRIMAP